MLDLRTNTAGEVRIRTPGGIHEGWTQAIAFDYDGTLAQHGQISDPARTALAEARAAGLALILVTGRRAPEIHRVFPQSESLFDAIVSENGALLSVRESSLRLAPVLPDALIDRLHCYGIDFELGECILSCDVAHIQTVSREISDLKLDLQVIPNRGRLMVLPAGVSKATGLNAVLCQLGLSPHNVIAVGDAENDVDMFNAVGTGVAVGDALDSVKSCAAVVLDRPGGEGVAELVCGRVTGKWGPLSTAPRTVEIGAFANGSKVTVPAAMANVLIQGASNAGKSTLAGLLIEGWTRLGYRVLIVDVEGDYVVLTAIPAKPGKHRQVLITDLLQQERPFVPDDRRTPHVRHWHKYAAATLPEKQWFWFTWPDGGVSSVARNVDKFATNLEQAPIPVLERHLASSDFSRWLLGLKSHDLAEIVHDIEVGYQQRRLSAEKARQQILAPFQSLFGLEHPAKPSP